MLDFIFVTVRDRSGDKPALQYFLVGPSFILSAGLLQSYARGRDDVAWRPPTPPAAARR